MATAPAELARIQAARAQLADRVAGLRGDFETLEDLLRGAAPGAAPGAIASRPRVMVNRALSEVLAAVPPVSESQGVAGLLVQLLRLGLRERSFDVVVPVTAPTPINDTGNDYDAGSLYDAWIVNPSIDTKIDFDKPPNQNTPFIAANTFMHFQVRKSKVYYLSQNPGTTGVMQVWLLKFLVG